MVLDVKYWIFLSFLLKLTGAEPQSQPTYRARDGEGVSPPPSGASSDKSCVRSYRAFKIKNKNAKNNFSSHHQTSAGTTRWR